MIKVLLVEDEELLLKKMSCNIDWKKNGYKVYKAVNGENAFEIIKSEKPEIIVTDIKMPGMSGIDLIKKSKKLEYKFIPIIISGYAEFEYAQESIHLNVEEYILKPFQSYRLLEIVENARQKLKKDLKDKKEINKLRSKIKEANQKTNTKFEFLSELYSNEINFKDFYDKHDEIFKYEDLFKVVKSGTQEEIIEHVSEFVEKLKKSEADKKEIKIIIQNILLLILKNIKDYGYQLDKLIEDVNIDNFKDENFKQIKDWILKLLLQINHYISKNKLAKNNKLIFKVNQLIKDKYQEGITLSSLADKFNVSASYLSKLFYEKNDVKFSTYIDNLRLQKAKELLKVTNFKVYEVAQEIGFDDPYYFSSWFKKHIGLSPTKYRERINIINE